jgi:membrane protease subunit (stomatin/prohibitin family)
MFWGAGYYRGMKIERDHASAYAQQQAAAQAPAPTAVDQLAKLAELKEQGVVTDAEFEVQKQKLLQGS